jgi:hypothetical protein
VVGDSSTIRDSINTTIPRIRLVMAASFRLTRTLTDWEEFSLDEVEFITLVKVLPIPVAK